MKSKKKNIDFYRNIINLIDSKQLKEAESIIKNNPGISKKYYFLERIEEQKLPAKIKQKYLDIGRYALEIEEYKIAYDYFLAGKYLSKNPIFDYYIGKTFYKAGEFTEALYYFDTYAANGSLKLEECYVYLFLITKWKGYETSNGYLRSVQKLDYLLENNLSYRDMIAKEEKALPVEEISYEENKEFKKTLKKIKKLLLQNQEKEANKLLKNLKPTNKDEKRKIDTLINNRKLYLNKLK